MQDPKNSTGLNEQNSSGRPSEKTFSENRRRLLQMGAAGMPMVLTLRASATEAVVSQLRCLITFSKKLRILVDDTGAAWVGHRNINTGEAGFKVASIDKFKDAAIEIFPAGTVPEQYRPEPCPDPCDDDGGSHGGGWGDDDDDGGGGHGWGEASASNGTPTSDEYGYTASDNLGRTGGGGGGGWGDDDGGSHGGGWGDDDGGSHGGSCDSGDPAWVDCGYAYYKYEKNSSITPGDYVTGNGGWTINGDEGLFLYLAIQHADSNPSNSAWPGISCIVSVLTYLGQQ